MIAKDQVGWALMMYELTDALEHLTELVDELSRRDDYSDEEMAIDLGHVYAHLNRAWYRRNIEEDFDESDRETASQFPIDLQPIG